MWAAMQEARPSVFTKTNNEGVDRVLKKYDYAFLMESTTIEYRMERNCDLDLVGGLIDNKGYGIALPRSKSRTNLLDSFSNRIGRKSLKYDPLPLDSPYRTPISGAILQLQEKGLLQDLKKKWWEERGGGLCLKTEQEPTSSSELGLANVGGVFLVLLIGTCGSFVIAVFEFLWNVRKVAVKEKVSLSLSLSVSLHLRGVSPFSQDRYLTLGSFSLTPTAETSDKFSSSATRVQQDRRNDS